MVPLNAHAKPEELTDRQWLLYLHIKSHLSTFGYAPSQRQLAALMNCSNHHAIQEILNCLERKGYVGRVKGVYRGLHVMKDPTLNHAA